MPHQRTYVESAGGLEMSTEAERSTALDETATFAMTTDAQLTAGPVEHEPRDGHTPLEDPFGATQDTRPVLTIGISGPTGSGKSLLCALLELALARSLRRHDTRLVFLDSDAILDQEALPLDRRPQACGAGSQDSNEPDCLIHTLLGIQETGQVPDGCPTFEPGQGHMRNMKRKLSSRTINEMANLVQYASDPLGQWKTICVVMGSSLYSNQTLSSMFDFGIFLRNASEHTKAQLRYSKAIEKAPIEERHGLRSVILFEDLVRQSYFKEHSFLFPEGDTEAVLAPSWLEFVEQRYGIMMAPRPDMRNREMIRWSVSMLLAALARIFQHGGDTVPLEPLSGLSTPD